MFLYRVFVVIWLTRERYGMYNETYARKDIDADGKLEREELSR